VSVIIVQVAAYFSDLQFGFKNLMILNISSGIILSGFAFIGIKYFYKGNGNK
jgi:hypothetical protein